ncbi:MAG: class I SAM-dependent methyltransferase [Candidatus Thorarchaeota archaeon]|nr:MAG: class I SAM-dependent methyltransferase [Candidatus Thorarchaeota archaeon]
MSEGNRAKSGYEGIGRFYDLFADNSDILFFVKYAKKFGSPILDIAAGTGRVSFVLAEKGYHVVALERSPSMIEIARQRFKTASQTIANNLTIIEGDMTNFNIDCKFHLVIIPNSFGHAISTEEQLSTLRCIHNHLSDDGIFILDIIPGALQYEHAEFKENPVSFSNDSTVEREGIIHSDMLRQLMQVNLRYIVRDSNQNIIEEVKVESSAALLFDKEIDLLIHLARFEIENEFGGFDESAYTTESVRRILILKKSNEE